MVLPALAAVLCLAPPAGADPPAWQSYEGHIYALTAVAGNWSEAQAQAEFHGGDLVTINDADENAWLLSTFGPITMWIGLHQPPGTGEPAEGWQWVSGDAVTYTNWHPTQPDNYYGDDYARMNSDVMGWHDGVWDDVPVEGHPGPSPGIIEVIPEPAALGLLALGVVAMLGRPRRPGKTVMLVGAVLASLCLAPPAGAHMPTWQSYDGHIYTLTDTSGSWPDMQAHAEFHGGNLVTINDQDETDWILGTFGTDPMWIGLYQPAGSAEPAGGWQWISGEPVTYTNWVDGTPDDWLENEDYAVMCLHNVAGWLEGKWNDVPPEGWPAPHPGLIEAVALPPAAAANGPYTLWVDDPLVLNASGSTDGNNDIVSYEWDLDDDGSFETDSGADPFCVVPYADVVALGLVLDGPYDIHLRVTDATGLADADDTILRIVPEPAALGLLAAGGLVLIRRPRRHASS
jgi:hypothetical protein